MSESSPLCTNSLLRTKKNSMEDSKSLCSSHKSIFTLFIVLIVLLVVLCLTAKMFFMESYQNEHSLQSTCQNLCMEG